MVLLKAFSINIVLDRYSIFNYWYSLFVLFFVYICSVALNISLKLRAITVISSQTSSTTHSTISFLGNTILCRNDCITNSDYQLIVCTVTLVGLLSCDIISIFMTITYILLSFHDIFLNLEDGPVPFRFCVIIPYSLVITS